MARPQTAVGVERGRFQVTDGQSAILEALAWPQALEDAVRAHLRRELGIELDGSTGTGRNWKPGSVRPADPQR